jgi:uncharacterized protein YuzE
MGKPDRFAYSVTVETHDHSGAIVAVYVRIRKGKVASTEEHGGGNAFADYDRNGQLLGIELIGPCQISVLNQIAKAPQIRRVVRAMLPSGMIRKAA